MHGETERQPFLTGAEPILYVTDFPATLAFYTQKLGFAVDFTYGDPPFYGVVQRGRARLVEGSVFAGDVREREELLSASITLDSAAAIERLFIEYHANDVPFHLPLTTRPWGARNVIVRDPDGNLILFAAPSS